MKALNVTLADDAHRLKTVQLTSYEVLYSSAGLQLAGIQLVYALERIAKLSPQNMELSKLSNIRQILSDGLTLLNQENGKPQKGETFHPTVQNQLKLLALLASDTHKNPNAKALLNQLTPETPEIIHHLVSEYRRLLYIT